METSSTSSTSRGSASPPTSGSLTLRDISKSFGRVRVLEDVSLDVASGEQRALIGPNGAGKTTLFNVVAGDLPASGGSIFLDGEDVTHLPAHRRARRGIRRTFQVSMLFPKLTVLENVLLGVQAESHRRFLALSSRWGEDLMSRAMDLLERVGLHAKANVAVGELSHGEQRQIEICLAASQRPRILMLDEPAAGLATADLPLITEALKELCSGVTLIVIEHDMSVAFGIAERVTVLHHGGVVADGTTEEVRADPKVQEIYLGGLE